MALREFVDGQNVDWKVWDITPELLHPATTRDMFQGAYSDYQRGWLVFESAHERRRLAPFPAGWEELPVERLEELLAAAKLVPTRLGAETRSGAFRRLQEDRAARPASETPAASPSAAAPAGTAGGEAARERPHAVFTQREFEGPSGRRWMARLIERADTADGGPGQALRFTSADGTACEVATFPDDWARLTRERLLELLRHAAPVGGTGTEGPPRRRRADFQP